MRQRPNNSTSRKQVYYANEMIVYYSEASWDWAVFGYGKLGAPLDETVWENIYGLYGIFIKRFYET